MTREYLRTRRSFFTAESAGRRLYFVLRAPDEFLARARVDRCSAEDQLIGWALKRRGGVSPTTLRDELATVKGFLDYSGVPLAWKRIYSATPKPLTLSTWDRAVTTSEIKKVLSVRNRVAPGTNPEWVGTRERLRALILMLASSGMRTGAFWFQRGVSGITYMRLGDVEFLDSGIGRVRVYRGDPQGYPAFISSEACAALRQYLAVRRGGLGEVLTEDSPVIRSNHTCSPKSLDRKRKALGLPSGAALPLHSWGVSEILKRAWADVGLGRGSRQFKAGIGMRKFFRTQSAQAAGSRLSDWDGSDDLVTIEDVEMLMGHRVAYYGPPVERLEAVYLTLQPRLLFEGKGASKVPVEVKPCGRSYDEPGLWRINEEIKRIEQEVKRLTEAFDTLTAEVVRVKTIFEATVV